MNKCTSKKLSNINSINKTAANSGPVGPDCRHTKLNETVNVLYQGRLGAVAERKKEAGDIDKSD